MGRVLRALTWLFVCALVGVFAMLAIAKHNLATARFTQDVVVTVATPGFNLSSAEQGVTEQLEAAIAPVKGLESIRSTTTSDSVAISVRATAIGLDSTPPVSLVQEAIRAALPRLPQELSVPVVQLVEPDPPTRHFVARSDSMTRLELSGWLDEVLRRQVEVQRGVRGVELCGAVRPELKVTLDQARLRALGLRADEVVSALQLSSLELPGGRITEQGLALKVRGAGASLEAIQQLELRGAQVKLRDVATIELGAESASCTTAAGMLVSVRMFAGGDPQVPNHPAVKLTPFTPRRTATFLSAPGNSVEGALRELSRLYPGAVIEAEGDTFTLMFPEEPELKDVPGLALRSLDDEHTVVRVSGPDFAQLTTLGGTLREALAKEHPRWLGIVWPNLSPERVIAASSGMKDVAQTLRLAIEGVETGRLADGTPVRVRAGTSIDDAVLPDGRPLREAVQISEELAPAAMLRVDRQRAVELEVGLERSAVADAVKKLQLPAGYAVSVSPSR